MLDDILLVNVKDTALGTCMSGNVINRQLMNTENGVIRANNLEMLKEFGGTIKLIEGLVRNILKSLNWSKRSDDSQIRAVCPASH